MRAFIGGALLLLSCESHEPMQSSTTEVQKLTVFAASSLKEAVQEQALLFERQHPHTQVRLNFAGSQVLRLQIEQGAEADLLISANEEQVASLVEQNKLKLPTLFAHNRLTVIVPLDNPAELKGVEGLSQAKRLVIGSKAVPVGAYTQELFANLEKKYGEEFLRELKKNVVSEESNVRLARAKVELGQADAAVVYQSDALSSKSVKEIKIPAELSPRASYPMAVLKSSRQPELAKAFVEFLLSPEGQNVLKKWGFLPGAEP